MKRRRRNQRIISSDRLAFLGLVTGKIGVDSSHLGREVEDGQDFNHQLDESG